MMDILLETVSSGGSVALIMTTLFVFTFRWLTKDIARVRTTGKEIIAQKDQIIREKENEIKELNIEHSKTVHLMNTKMDDKIKELTRDFDQKIEAKDKQIQAQHEQMQHWIIKDVETKTQFTDAVTTLTEIIKVKI